MVRLKYIELNDLSLLDPLDATSSADCGFVRLCLSNRSRAFSFHGTCEARVPGPDTLSSRDRFHQGTPLAPSRRHDKERSLSRHRYQANHQNHREARVLSKDPHSCLMLGPPSMGTSRRSKRMAESANSRSSYSLLTPSKFEKKALISRSICPGSLGCKYSGRLSLVRFRPNPCPTPSPTPIPAPQPAKYLGGEISPSRRTCWKLQPSPTPQPVPNPIPIDNGGRKEKTLPTAFVPPSTAFAPRSRASPIFSRIQKTRDWEGSTTCPKSTLVGES